jgi:hypothetical protein
VPAAPLAAKTVIDTCNYGPERDGHIPELDNKSLTSSELLLRYVPDALLVKAACSPARFIAPVQEGTFAFPRHQQPTGSAGC